MHGRVKIALFALKIRSERIQDQVKRTRTELDRKRAHTWGLGKMRNSRWAGYTAAQSFRFDDIALGLIRYQSGSCYLARLDIFSYLHADQISRDPSSGLVMECLLYQLSPSLGRQPRSRTEALLAVPCTGEDTGAW